MREDSSERDIDIKVAKEKAPINMRAAGEDEALQLIPPKVLSLKQASEFIKEDDLVEVPPLSVRIKKRSSERTGHK